MTEPTIVRGRRPSDPTDVAWDAAVLRHEVLSGLAQHAEVSRSLAEEQAARLGISSRQLRRLLKTFQISSRNVTDVLALKKGAVVGGSRVHPAVEGIIQETIRALYLTRQKLTVAAVYRAIIDRCGELGLRPPSRNTVTARIRAMSPALVAGKREGPQGRRPLTPSKDGSWNARFPLQRVEIDHTPVDLMIVDSVERRELGRPSLTLAVDKFSRAIVGMHLTLEAPSLLSVGLCLSQVISDKSALLAQMGVDAAWPMTGKPVSIGVDNAVEFHSNDLKRGCQQHGMKIDFRRPWKPEDGGTIERLIGTVMKKVHSLSGTTFSNIEEKGEYPSQKLAIVTLKELEKWLLLAIAEYHGTVHNSLRVTPAEKWRRGVEIHGAPSQVADETSFLLDFLPSELRKLRRTGFQLDWINYYSPALNPWIERAKSLPKFRIIRDPRDVSQVWVKLPDQDGYLLLPSASLHQEPMSVEEWKRVSRLQTKEGILGQDNTELARLRLAQRALEEEAAESTRHTRESTRHARRKTERLKTNRPTPRLKPQPPPIPVLASFPDDPEVSAYEELEDW